MKNRLVLGTLYKGWTQFTQTNRHGQPSTAVGCTALRHRCSRVAAPERRPFSSMHRTSVLSRAVQRRMRIAQLQRPKVQPAHPRKHPFAQYRRRLLRAKALRRSSTFDSRARKGLPNHGSSASAAVRWRPRTLLRPPPTSVRARERPRKVVVASALPPTKMPSPRKTSSGPPNCGNCCESSAELPNPMRRTSVPSAGTKMGLSVSTSSTSTIGTSTAASAHDEEPNPASSSSSPSSNGSDACPMWPHEQASGVWAMGGHARQTAQ